MNYINIEGTLPQDAQIKDINGVQYVAFTVTDSRKKADGTWAHTYYEVLSRSVKMQPYLVKGKAVNVRGVLDARAFTDKNTGQPRPALSVMADRLDFAVQSRTPDPNAAPAQHPQQPAYTQYQQQPAPQQWQQQTAAQPQPAAVPLGQQDDSGLPF